MIFMKKGSINIALVFASLFGLIGLTSCPKPAETPISYPNLLIQFDHRFDGNPLELNKIYLTANMDSIELLEHKYIVSNISFINSVSGLEKKLNNSYFLVKVSPDTNIYTLSIPGASTNLPSGIWDKVEFLIGLDSATNFAPDGAPKLFSDEGMFWDWNTGYKFFVTEGRYYSQALPFPSTGLIAHIGDMVNLVKISLDLAPNGGLQLVDGKTTELGIRVNVDELFFNPILIDLSQSKYQQAMGGPQAIDYRENYSNNFWVLNSVSIP